MSLDDDLRAYAQRRTAADPSRAEAEALIRRAIVRQSRRWVLPMMGGLGVGGVAVAVLGLLFLASPAPTPDPFVGPAVVVVAPVERVLTDGVHSLGEDVLTVQGEVRVTSEPDEVRVVLSQGQVGVQAWHRAPGQHLLVVSGEHTVEVVGTRFDVRSEPFDVVVFEGIVEVHGPGGTRRLVAGDRFLAPADTQPAPSVVPRVAPPSVDDLADLVLSDQLPQARAGLERRLLVDPDDVASWRLLARLEVRAGQPEAAIAAWTEVATRGTRADGREASLALADLLDDQPITALSWMERAAVDPGDFAPEIGLRLGRLRRRTGDVVGAAAAWRAVVQDHPQTAAAAAARRELDGLPTP